MDVPSVQYAAWCTVGTIFWLLVVDFIVQRWRSIRMGVRANIERYNRIDAEQRLRDADDLVRRSGGCPRCFGATERSHQAVATTTTTIRNESNTIRLTGSTITESDTDPVVPTEAASSQQTGKRVHPFLHARRSPALARRVIADAASAAVTATGDVKILETCRTRSIVSRLAQQFESKTANNNYKVQQQQHLAMATVNTIGWPVLSEEEEHSTMEQTEQKYILLETTDDEFGEADEDDQQTMELPNGFSSYLPSPEPVLRTTASPLTPPHSENDDDDEDDEGYNTKSCARLNNTTITTSPSNDLQLRCSSLDDLLGGDDDGGGDLADSSSENDVQMRRRSADLESNVRTFEDVMRQARFSKCYSEYSISDLLLDLAAEDANEDADVTQVREADLATICARIP